MSEEFISTGDMLEVNAGEGRRSNEAVVWWMVEILMRGKCHT